MLTRRRDPNGRRSREWQLAGGLARTREGGDPRHIVLSPSWELTTADASSNGQPALVHRWTGEAFGPGDIMRAYPGYGWQSAAAAVRRLTKTAHLNAGGKALVARFVGSLPPADDAEPPRPAGEKGSMARTKDGIPTRPGRPLP